jgi:hypothetical protein
MTSHMSAATCWQAVQGFARGLQDGLIVRVPAAPAALTIAAAAAPPCCAVAAMIAPSTCL